MEKRNREAPISCYGTTETLCLMLYCDDDSNRLKPTPLTEFRYDDLPPDMPQRVWVRHPALARGYWQRPAASGQRSMPMVSEAAGFLLGTCFCTTMAGSNSLVATTIC